ncbi:MAG: hypothetical protein ISS36_04725 [Candidatus Aenigmarchaeota archaeon]|nr:hypothetical protein [Candidatus Aenigmarchaeota archaeon]
MLSKDVKEIMEKYKEYLQMFEEFDRTGKFPLERVRIDLTLQRRNIDKLKKISKKENKKMSHLIDELIEKY